MSVTICNGLFTSDIVQIFSEQLNIKGFLSITCMIIKDIQSPCASKHYAVLFNHNYWKSIRFADFNQ